MNQKLIVSTYQAQKIKADKVCVIAMDMRSKDGHTPEFLANKKFKDQTFWVAEPMCSIKKDIERHHHHFACDSIPKGWSRYTLNRPGSRVHFGEHRHWVKCIDLQLVKHSSGQMFTVLITIERVGADA